MGWEGRAVSVMHLIRHCSICGNKYGRLSDSVPSRHVSSPLPARLPPAFLSSTLSAPLNAAVPFLWFPPDSGLSPALSTWASFLKPSSSYLLSSPHHTYNPSVLSRNLKLINLFPFPLFQIASPPARSCFSSSLFFVFFFYSSPSPTYIAHVSARRRCCLFAGLKVDPAVCASKVVPHKKKNEPPTLFPTPCFRVDAYKWN